MSNARSTRLLVVALNYAPELTGIGKYVGEMTEWLATKKVDIRVVTAPPYYPAWSIKSGYNGRRYKVEELAGARVFRCPIWVPREPRALTRILHLFSFAITSLPVMLWQALFWRPDIVFVVEPPICAAPGAWLAAKIAGARSWLHVQDFEIDAAFELGMLRAGWLRRAVRWAERVLMRRFDHVSSISEGMRNKLHKKGIGEKHTLFFPNWVDMSLIHPLQSTAALRRELQIDDDVQVVLYSGNMGEKQGLDVIIDVARQFQEDDKVLFLLCGDGVVRTRIAAAALQMKNVRLIELQPLARLNELLNLADVHLVPQRAAAEDLALPSKLGAILASGRPVVATARKGSDIARFADNGGLVVPPADTVAFELAIRQLLSDAPLRRQLGAEGRACALANWERETVMRRTFAEIPVFNEFAKAELALLSQEMSTSLLRVEDQPIRP
jgi:colanic acid biosynthesis glycosyl transferase WcaI